MLPRAPDAEGAASPDTVVDMLQTIQVPTSSRPLADLALTPKLPPQLQPQPQPSAQLRPQLQFQPTAMQNQPACIQPATLYASTGAASLQ